MKPADEQQLLWLTKMASGGEWRIEPPLPADAKVVAEPIAIRSSLGKVVLCGYLGHPGLAIDVADARYLAAASPRVVQRLIEDRRRLIDFANSTRRTHNSVTCAIFYRDLLQTMPSSKPQGVMQCSCGADEHNAEVDKLIADLES